MSNDREWPNSVKGAPIKTYLYIVMRHPDDTPAGWQGLPSKTHSTAMMAEKEAERLSILYQNTRFCVGVLYMHYLSYAKTAQVSYSPIPSPLKSYER